MTIAYCDGCGAKIDIRKGATPPTMSIQDIEPSEQQNGLLSRSWRGYDLCDQCLGRLHKILHYASWAEAKGDPHVP